jgi:predicted membrane protein
MDKSEEVRVDLKMGAGELRVDGGAEKLMEGRFRYNRLQLRPEISYTADGSRSHLVVEEPSHVSTGTHKYVWDLRFNNEKPLDLEVNCGAGESRLDLGDLTLRRVNVEMGVGQLKMDLRGTPKNDYEVNVHGGVGEATIYLPKNVGIDAHVEGGIGGIHAPGLEKRESRYVNDSYGHAKTTVRLDVEGGIGAINLIAN